MNYFFCNYYFCSYTHTDVHPHIHRHMVKVLRKKWISSQEMDTATQVQILNEAVCILQSTNTLGKGMNLIILSPVMGKIVVPTGPFSLGMATYLGEGKTLNLNLLNST